MTTLGDPTGFIVIDEAARMKVSGHRLDPGHPAPAATSASLRAESLRPSV